MTLYEDYITFGLTPLQGFTHVLARSINCNLSLMPCLYLQFQFRWTTRALRNGFILHRLLRTHLSDYSTSHWQGPIYLIGRGLIYIFKLIISVVPLLLPYSLRYEGTPTFSLISHTVLFVSSHFKDDGEDNFNLQPIYRNSFIYYYYQYCSGGEIRTHTEQVLNLLTLPVGLHRHFVYVFFFNKICRYTS